VRPELSHRIAVIAAIMGGLILLIKEQAFILAETHTA